MIHQKTKIRRLSIYFFYDSHGFVGDYVVYYLQNIRSVCSESCVVVNEPLSVEGRKKLESCCDTLLVRENVGFDSAAYKYAIQHYGYNYIRENFDQVILNNFTFYGPIYSFHEVFEKMDNKDCDMWGLTKHPEQDAFLVTGVNDSKIIEHIQSYFYVFKSSIINDSSFQEYWETLKVPYSYQQAILFHELRCSNFFEKKGFKTDTYTNYQLYKDYKINHSLFFAKKMLEEDKIPIVKRKAFFLDNKQWMSSSTGCVARELLDYIDKHTSYDVDLIWRDLIKTQKMSVLRNQLHLNYYLPNDRLINDVESKVSMILYVNFKDQIDHVLKYVSNMPDSSDIYVISTSDFILELYKSKTLSISSEHSFYFRLMEQNHGRDASAYLVAASDIFSKYDYVCCVHDDITMNFGDQFASDEFKYYCYENCLSSSLYVKNIIATFVQNPRLGMLVPPALDFGPFFNAYNRKFMSNPNIENVKRLYKEFNITVPFDDHAVVPFGTMFWVRGDAFKTILTKKWNYDDFSKSPNDNIDALYNALEMFYPISVQESGYYVGFLATSYFASVISDCTSYFTLKFNEILARKCTEQAKLQELLNLIN